MARPGGGARGTFDFKACSVNVTSLKPKCGLAAYNRVAGKSMVSRVQVVEHVLNDYGVMLAGLQEGRAKSKAVQNGVFYTMYCSPADEKGSYGSQVWIHNSVQFRPSCWKDVAPRIVYVDGTSRKWARKVRVVSAHAPHEKSPLAEKDC